MARRLPPTAHWHWRVLFRRSFKLDFTTDESYVSSFILYIHKFKTENKADGDEKLKEKVSGRASSSPFTGKLYFPLPANFRQPGVYCKTVHNEI